MHPYNEEDAEERFKLIAAAYDVLSDPTSRGLYDQYGAEGMKKHKGSGAGRGNSGGFWDEIKPFVRSNKNTQARDASTQRFGNNISDLGGSRGEGSFDATAEAQVGDVVEYPLPQHVTDNLQDGRTHGVGLLINRNMDRGDAAILPAEVRRCRLTSG